MAATTTSLIERAKIAKTKLANSIIDKINMILIDAVERSLTSDIISIKISVLRDWDFKYKSFLENYYKNQGIHLVITDTNLCFNLPSYAMDDNLNKTRRYTTKAFEISLDDSTEDTVVTRIIEARNAKIAAFIKSLEDDFIKEIEERLLFQTEKERTFIYSLEARFPNREKMERYCIGRTIQNHFIKNEFLCQIEQNNNNESDNLIIIIPSNF